MNDLCDRIDQGLDMIERYDRDLHPLMTDDKIRTAVETNRKCIAVGEILDSMSPIHFEWYGYALSEAKSLFPIVDVLIQPKQIVTGGDVDFLSRDFMLADAELDKINREEGRLGTGRELTITGIVHRHGFTTGVPRRSADKDVRNFSNFMNHYAALTMQLAKDKDRFFEVGGYNTSIEGDSLVLDALSEENISLILQLDSKQEEADFLRSAGIDPDNLKFIGGLRGVLQRYFCAQQRVSAQQGLYVCEKKSVIYNMHGTHLFGEIGILAKGAVNNLYEKTFEVPVLVDDKLEGRGFNPKDLEKEVDDKISWRGKSFKIVYKRGGIETTESTRSLMEEMPKSVSWIKFPPENIDTFTVVEKNGTLDLDDLALNFYFNASIYINSIKLQSVNYSDYLFRVLREIRNCTHLAGAFKKVGQIFGDSVTKGGETVKPPLEALSKKQIYDSIYSPDIVLRDLEETFIRDFNEARLEEKSKILEKYVPLFINLSRGENHD